MKGGHGDNYYYEMVANIRRFKGVPEEPTASAHKTIHLQGNTDFSQWDDVMPVYTAHKGNTLHRDSPGWKGYHYTNQTGRNDIIRAKVTTDTDFVYFYVQTADTLTSATDPNWMQLFIDTDRSKKNGLGRL